MMLDAASVIARAQDNVGLSDPEPYLRKNLEALLESIAAGPALHAEGIAATERSLVAFNTNRLEGLRWLRDHPEIAAERIERPVFLCGLPRSGTTYLQYLFDQDRRFRLLRTWEAIMPNPPPGADPDSVAQRKAIERERNRQFRARDVEDFDALHLIDEDGPQECHVILEQAFATAGAFNLYDAPEYFEFLLRELDLEAAYQVHHRQFQLLQWRTTQPRWALKYPNHVLALDAICKVYPDARFVMTHRDPLQTLASIAKMTLALRTSRYEAPVDRDRVGRQMLDFIGHHVDRILAFDAGPEARRVAHVDYYRLVADPLASLRGVHETLGEPTPADVEQAITHWRQANPKNRRGANDYALDQFGIRADEARERFAEYIRRFDIPSEAEGVAAAA